MLYERREYHLPVVKDLTPNHVSSHTPAVCVSLMPQPIVPQHLSIEVVRLERRVVYVRLWSFEEEEAVVVDKLPASVEAKEDGHIHTLIVVYKLAIR